MKISENQIKKVLDKLVSEETVPGVEQTKKVSKESKKHNDEHLKDSEKKLKDFEKTVDEKEEKGSTKDIKFNGDEDQKEYHDQMETLNGQEMLDYDTDPGERFNDRAEKSIVGDSTTGNPNNFDDEKTDSGEGNTKPTWNASSEEFGKKLIDRIKSSNKKRNDAQKNITQFGDDIELGGPAKLSKRKTAIKENTKMKRLKFKKSFEGEDKAMKLIPESYKKDDLVFEMTDGNETYLVRWEGDIQEGAPVVLHGENKKLINEARDKAKHLMNYSPNKSLGRLNNSSRLNENDVFSKMMNKNRQMINESKEKE